jgi:hypothetical protein
MADGNCRNHRKHVNTLRGQNVTFKCQCRLCGPQQRGRYTDWLRARGSGNRIPVGTRFSAPFHTDPGAHPISYTNNTTSMPGVKRPRCGVNHPPRPMLTKKFSYTSNLPVCLDGRSRGDLYFLK